MRRTLVAAAFAAAGCLVVLLLHALGALERLELLTLDLRYATGIGRKAPGDDIVVAWIDQESLEYMEREGTVSWPWPRELYGQVLDHLREQGAKAVAFDILFDQRGAIAASDTAFATALANGTGDVLAMKFVGFRDGGRDAAETAAFGARAIPGAAAHLELPRERGVVLPFAELQAGADRLGFVNIRPDADAAFRHYDLLRPWGPPGEPAGAHASLALAAALAATGATELGTAAATRVGLPAHPAVPVTDGARMLLNFRGGAFTFAKVKLVNVFASMLRAGTDQPPLYPPDTFRDRIVLVGIHADGLEDAHPTPLDERFPGVELHATALDNLLRGDSIAEPAWGAPLALAAAGVAAAAVFALPGVAVPVAVLVVLALAGVVLTLLAWGALVAVPVAAPVLAGGTTAAGGFLWRLVVEGRQRRELRRAFQSYLSPAVLREVLADPAALQLGGQEREVTLLFTDLQGFTGIGERVPPRELVAFLNDYFTRVCEPLLEQRGVVDKFLGDSVMAFFGAPVAAADHAAAAVRAALGAMAVGDAVARETVAKGLPPVRTRVGVHSGRAVIGNMGSRDRFDYTAIGDTVNLASRLEGANKHFGTRCLVSGATWDRCGGAFAGREVGRVAVAGRGEPITVFEPFAERTTATEDDVALAAAWGAAVDALRAGDRDAARSRFEALRAHHPDDALLLRWLDALREPVFDGTFRLDAK